MFLDSPSAAEYDSRESGVFNVQTKLGGKFWTAMLIFGLMGQIAWVVENMYFNVFIYKMFHASASDISVMVMASAVTAAVTTILMGAASDMLGKRKAFMSFGYLIWGLTIISFDQPREDRGHQLHDAAGLHSGRLWRIHGL